MNEKKTFTQGLFMICIVIVSLIHLNGCTTNQDENTNTKVNTNELVGTWRGTLQIPMFRDNNTSSISQITFSIDQIEMLLEFDNRTSTMNFTYTKTNNTLILSPIMSSRTRLSARQPFNGTIPLNETQPTMLPNGTQPPGNGTWPLEMFNRSWLPNETRLPGSNVSPIAMIIFYVFDKNTMMLYLNDSPFIKIQ